MKRNSRLSLALHTLHCKGHERSRAIHRCPALHQDCPMCGSVQSAHLQSPLALPRLRVLLSLLRAASQECWLCQWMHIADRSPVRRQRPGAVCREHVRPDQVPMDSAVACHPAPSCVLPVRSGVEAARLRPAKASMFGGSQHPTACAVLLRQNLNLVRLPIPPHPHVRCLTQGRDEVNGTKTAPCMGLFFCNHR